MRSLQRVILFSLMTVLLVQIAGCSRRVDPTRLGGAQCEARSVSLAEGRLITVRRFDYDRERRFVRAEWECHEVFETRGAIMTFEYDGAGRLARRTSDEDADGTIDTIHRLFRDGSGRVQRIETENVGSPRIDVTEYSYDDAGARVRTVWRNGEKLQSTRTVVYDAGRRARVVTATKADGTVYQHLREELDEAGRVLRMYALDGTAPRLLLERAYGPAGGLVREMRLDVAGASESTETYSYDGDGTLTGDESTIKSRPSVRTEYHYRGTWKAARCGELPDDLTGS